MGDNDPFFVVAHETAPSDHSAKGPLDPPAAGENLESLLLITAADNVGDEVEIAGLFHELQAMVGTVGEEMLHPRPALADAIENGLGLRCPKCQRLSDRPSAGAHRYSTAMCRLRPTAFLPASKPRSGLLPAPDVPDQASVQCRGSSETGSAAPVPGTSHKPSATPKMDRKHPPATARTNQVANRPQRRSECSVVWACDCRTPTSPPSYLSRVHNGPHREGV